MLKTATLSKPNNAFRHQVLIALNHGIRNKERFEDLSSEILNDIANQLVLVEDYGVRRQKLNALLKQIEEAQIVRRYNMMIETPDYNKQFSAALTYLSNQFKVRFSKYGL